MHLILDLLHRKRWAQVSAANIEVESSIQFFVYICHPPSFQELQFHFC